MDALADLPPLREVVRAYGLDAKKSLGQNYLFDLNLTRKIARSTGSLDGVTVIEVGPGPGGLTRALLEEGARRVVAIETDGRFLPALDDIAHRAGGRLTVVHADALAVEYQKLADGHAARIVANLPYNIATPLLIGWLKASPWPPWWQAMAVMVQREVGLRIVATPQQRAAFGRLAVLSSWRAEAKLLFDVPPAAFTPPPSVVSSVVRLVPRETPLPCDVEALEKVTAAAFGQRRKMLRQSLKTLCIDPLSLIAAAGLADTMRAEEASVSAFVAMANTYGRLLHPGVASN